MKAVIAWFFVLLALFLLAILKIGIRFCWEKNQARLQILIGKLRISLPKEKKEKKEKTESKAQPKIDVAEKKASGNGKKWAMAALAHWQEILALLGRVLRTPTLSLLWVHISVGGSDAADCALKYGQICAGVSGVLPVLENTFHVERQDVQVTCDYDKEQTEFLVQTEITVRIYEIFALASAGLKLFLRIYRETKDKKKAVQTK